MANKTPNPVPQESFEASIQRLETIVEAMESDKLPLEELLVRYEEGIKLVKVCQEKIQSAEKRIELITRDASGKAQLSPFEPSNTPAAPASTPSDSPSQASHPVAEDVSLF